MANRKYTCPKCGTTASFLFNGMDCTHCSYPVKDLSGVRGDDMPRLREEWRQEKMLKEPRDYNGWGTNWLILFLAVGLVTALRLLVVPFLVDRGDVRAVNADGLHPIGLAFGLAAVGITAGLVINGFKRALVPPGRQALLVSFGRRLQRHTLREGINFVPPWVRIDELVDTREKEFTVEGLEAHASDHAKMGLALSVQYRVVNLYRASDVDGLPAMLKNAARDAAGEVVGKSGALEVAISKEETASRVAEALQKRAARWGVRIDGASITKMHLPPEVERFIRIADMMKKEHPELSTREILALLQTQHSAHRIVVDTNSI